MGAKQQQDTQHGSSGSSGLAYLVQHQHSSSPAADAAAQTALLLDYVFQLPAADAAVCKETGDILYPQLSSSVSQHITALKQQPPSSAEASSSSSSTPQAEQPRGRVGPRDVAIDRSSVCGSFGFSTDGLSLEALGNFTSCRANVAVFAGKWFYECTVLTPGIQQIGWATTHCPFTAEEGVGDAPDSYAVDGKRLRKWNVKPQPYGESWVQGDVMGCAIDLDSPYGSVTFYRNGQSLGVAYDRVRTMQPSLAYFPAISLSHTERCSLNFGAKPFTYPVPGYQPLQAPPSAGDRAAAAYCCGCLARLAVAAVQRPEGGGSGGSSAAADSGGSAAAAAASEKKRVQSEREVSLVVDQLVQGGVPAAAVGAGGAAAASNQPVAAAAVAAAALAPGGSSSGCIPGSSGSSAGGGGSSSGGGMAVGRTPPFPGPAAPVSSADMLLLSSVVLAPLQQLLVLQPYLVQAALLPLLTELQRLSGGEGGGGGSGSGQQQPPQQLLLMLQLMHVVWGDNFKHIVFAVLEELAYRCQVSPLLVQNYPYTAAYPHLLLAVSLLQHKPCMRLFVRHPDFYIVMEGLLARKAPSPRDLQLLLPHVWWAGCKDETASEERLRASVGIITTTVAKVEQQQYELLELLLATPWCEDSSSSNNSSSAGSSDRTSTSSTGSGSAGAGGDTPAPAAAAAAAAATNNQSSSSSSSSGCALLVFLRFLLQKNMYALRDVPPPGLSEPTVLMSAFFGLLQLLQPALQAACDSGSGPLAAFPAAELFAGVGPAAEAEPVFNMPRLGGVVTHLAREHPVSDAERQPVAVGLQHQGLAAGGQQQQAGGSAGAGASSHLQACWVPELLNSCLLLYAWRVGFNYKMIHNLSSTVAASSTALEDLDRMIAQNDGQQMSSWLHGTRKVYHDELSRDVRLLTLLCVAFFSPGKQAALAQLSRYLALLTTAVSDTQPSPLPQPSPLLATQQQGLGQQSGVVAAGATAVQQPSTPPARGGRPAAAAAAAPSDSSSSGSDGNNLLRYVPVVYVEVVVDFLTVLRKAADAAVGAPAMELQPQAADAFISWACCVLNNPCIANPDIAESLLAVVGLLLDNAAWRALLEGGGGGRQQQQQQQGQQQGQQRQDKAVTLMQGLLRVFDTRLWHPTTGVLLKVIQDCGFGHPTRQPHPPHSLQHVLLSLLQDDSSSSRAAAVASAAAAAGDSRPELRQEQQHPAGETPFVTPLPSPASAAPAAAAADTAGAAAAAAEAAADARGFVNRLFSTLNWTLTEFTVAVGELHTLRGQRSILEVQNQYRRTGLMFELSVNFLRLLEFVVPTPAFLSNSVNRTRLRELLQFVLSHFTNGPDARRLNELLQTSQPVVLATSSGGGAAGGGAAGGAGGAAAGGAAAGGAASSSSAAPAAGAGARRGGGAAGAAGGPPPVRQGPMQPSPAAVAAVAAGAPLAGSGGGVVAGMGPLSAAAAAAAAGAAGGGPGVPAYALQALRLESSSLSERVQKTALLAPLMGILLALWDAYLAATAAADSAAAVAAGSSSGSGSSSGQAAVLQELAELADDRFMSSLRFLQDVDWSAAFPSQPLSVPLRAFGQLLHALAAARAELAAADAAAGIPAELPDDFLDPITMELLRDPVVLPDSQIVVDRSTIERHLLSSATDPFSRAPLSMEQLLPATELSSRMQQWMQQHKDSAKAAAAAAAAAEAETAQQES